MFPPQIGRPGSPVSPDCPWNPSGRLWCRGLLGVSVCFLFGLNSTVCRGSQGRLQQSNVSARLLPALVEPQKLRLSAAGLSCAQPPCQITAAPLPARCRQPAPTQASPPRWTQARSGCRKPAAFGFCSLQLPGLEEPASSGTPGRPHCPSPACVPRSGVSNPPRVSWLLALRPPALAHPSATNERR